MTDNGDTFIFKPEETEKPAEKEKIARTEVDEFTIARKVRVYDEEEEKEEKSPLTVVAYVLGALLVLAIVAMVIFLTSGGEEAPPQPPKEQETTLPATDKTDDEEEEEEEIVIKEYTVAYNGGKIYEMENNGGFSVVFEVYDDKNNKTGDEKLYITEETVIKDENRKIGTKHFITFIENQAGDVIFFNCEVREEDSVVLTINYSSSGYVEEEEPEEEVVEEEIIGEEENISDENPLEEPSTEEPAPGIPESDTSTEPAETPEESNNTETE